jgi:glutathione-regulated potassium-efflux system ancillary protein KefF
MILLIYAHPYPQHSRATKALLDAVSDLPNVEIRSLYDAYPDFDIDVKAEQAALLRADLVVWLHPIYWYSVPAMLKHYFDVVLTLGWAYGEVDGMKGRALAGKQCLWVTTTGGPAASYAEDGAHQLPFAAYETPVRQTALFCDMAWMPPLTLHGAHVVSDDEVKVAAQQFRARLIAHSSTHNAAQIGGNDVN